MTSSSPDLRDWAKECCLGKAFLDCVSNRRGGGFELYLRYLNETSLTDEELNFSGLSRFGPLNASAVAAHQYKVSEPYTEPAHWSFFSESDVNRIGNLAGVRIVIYNFDNGGRLCQPIPEKINSEYWIKRCEKKDDSRRLTLWHDSRLGLQAGENLCVLLACTSVNPKRLFKLPSDQADLLDGLCNVWFGQVQGPAREVCLSILDQPQFDFLSLVDSLLGIAPTAEKEDLEKITRLSEFWLADRHKLYRRWASAGSCLLLLSFERRWGKPNKKTSWLPKNLRFCCLAITSELTPAEACETDFVDHATPDAKVICFYGQKYAVLLSEPFRLQALTFHLDTRGLAEKLLNRSDLSGVPKTLSKDIFDQAKAENKLKRKRRAGDSIVKKCKCRDCKNLKYAENMSSAGPEQLCTVPLSIRDLLRMLGALSKRAESVIKRMVELSVASMDIESQTSSLDFTGPRPGPQTCYHEFGGPVLEGHLLQVQRPIMLGHTDALSRERGERWQDVVSDDSPKAVYDMFARYWLKVTKLKRAASREKKAICGELLELSSRYNEAFAAFASSWLEVSRIQKDHLKEKDLQKLKDQLSSGNLSVEQHQHLAAETEREYENSDDWVMAETKALASAFRNTVPGLLQSSLLKLCHRYVVFNFYG